MRVTLIAIHQDNSGNNIMFRLIDEDTNEIKDFPCEAVRNVLQSNRLPVNGIELSRGKLKGSNGSFDRYPTFINGVLARNNKRITILATIDDIGYKICDADGHVVEASTAALLEKRTEGLDVANGKIVSKNGASFFSAIVGNYLNIPIDKSHAGKKWLDSKKNTKQPDKTVETKNNEQDKPKIVKSITYNKEKDPRLPKVLTGVPRPDSKMKVVDPVTGMTLEQKMAYIMIAVQTVRPFYYAVLALLKRVEASDGDGIDTMAVSLDTLYFSPDFVLKTSLSDLLFIVLHEICHIAMKHRIRENGREHDAWNFATDYFINRHLADEFGLTEVGVAKKANLKAFSSEYSSYDISIPAFGLYNQAVDVNKDVPETLYEELQKNQQQQQQQQNNQSQSGQGQNSQDGQLGQPGNQGNQSQGSQSQSSQSQGSQSQSSQGQGSQSQSSQSQGSQGNQSQNQSSQEQISQSAQQMANGMQRVQQGMTSSGYNSHAQQQINDGMKDIQQGAQQMNSGIKNGNQEQIQQGAKQMQQGIDKVESGINQMENSQGQGDGNNQQAQNQMKQGLQDMKDALQGLEDGASQACNENNGGQSQSNANEPKYNESDTGNNNSGDAHNKSGGTQSVDGTKSDGKSDGKQSNTESDSNYNASEQRQQGRFAGKEFRGQSMPDIAPDMVDDNSTLGKTPEQMNQSASSLLSQAVTIHKQRHSFGGDTPDFLERYVEQALAPKVNWRSVLRRYLTKASQKEYTFAHPDKRFLNRKNADGSRQVFAGPHMADAGELENIKICIDTSGSISPKDIGQALSQIEDMFKQYRADAELLYWDTRVRAVYPFKQYKELLSKEPKGGGGTDANCIFDYFETAKEYKLRKKPQPSLIIVFTDGVFDTIDSKYKRKYKNTVWIVHENPRFEAPFGVKAPLKINDI